jgi:hypothetical protein
MMRSLEARWLQQDHAQASRELKRHRLACIDCERAVRHRKPDDMCDEGKAIKEAVKALQEQAREAAALDKVPNPDQDALWSLDEIGAGP